MRYVFLILSALVLLTGCDKRSVRQVVKDISEMPADTAGLFADTIRTSIFSAVEVDCFADVSFHQTALPSSGDTGPMVRLMASSNVLKHLTVRVTDNVLRISSDRRYRLPEDAVVKADIYAPFSSSFLMNGCKCLRLGKLVQSSPLLLEIYGNIGSMTSESLNAPEIKLKIDGDGTADFRGIDTKTLRVDVNSEGPVVLKGKAETACVKYTRKGSVDTDSLKCGKMQQELVSGNIL